MELKGKKLLFLGDSITEGTGVNEEKNIYLNRICRMAGAAQALNYGIGGTSIARNKAPGWRTGAFVVRAQTLPEEAWDADVAFIFGGTNDYGIGDGLFGEEDSCNPFEINGALNIIVQSLRGMNEKMRIVIISPVRRQNEEAPNAATGKPLKDYVELLRRAAERLSLPFCDLFHTDLFDPEDEAQRALYIPDGLHPNDDGHQRMAEALLKQITSIQEE